MNIHPDSIETFKHLKVLFTVFVALLIAHLCRNSLVRYITLNKAKPLAILLYLFHKSLEALNSRDQIPM